MRNKTCSLLKHPENLSEQDGALLRYFLDKLRSQFTDRKNERVN